MAKSRKGIRGESRWRVFDVAISKIKNIIEKQPVPDEKKDTSEGITLWESAQNSTLNNFPQQLLQNVYDSPIGSSALDVWQEFVQGGGFVSDIGDTPINKKETLDDLNQKLSQDITYLDGVAIHFSYNTDGTRAQCKHLPFESCRLGALNDDGLTDRIRFNPYYGIPNDFDKKYTKWFYTFTEDPKEVIAEIKAHNKALKDQSNKEITEPYPGQVFWFSIEKPLSRVYPQPFYFSSINWFRIDKEIQLFHDRNIKNNFLLSVIINIFGSPDDPAGEANDDGEQFSTVGEEFNKQMRSFSSADGSALINWFTREDEKASIEQFPTNSNHDLFIALQNLVAEQISIGTKVPPILLSIQQGGKLGDTQEILNAVRVMQARTRRKSEILSRIYTKIFKGTKKFKDGTDFTTKNINPFNILPDWVKDELTTEERRAYIEEHFNVDLIEKVATDDKPSADVSPEQLAAQAQLKGSVGGVQGILSIQQGVSAGLTTRESALEVFQLIYGFTLDEANRLLGAPETDLPPQETQVSAMKILSEALK